MTNPDLDTTKDIDAVPGEGRVDEDLERSLLLSRAAQMGLRIGPGIGLEKLRAKVNAAAQSQPDPDEGDDEPDEEDVPVVQKPAKARVKSREEIDAELRKSIHDEQMTLVRCRITNMNPDKRDLKGEILTVDNAYLGTVRKYVPFDGSTNEKGYHLPKCLLTFMREKVYTVKTPVKDRNGNVVSVQMRDMPEYAIETMDPLTPDELKELAFKQEAVARLDGLN